MQILLRTLLAIYQAHLLTDFVFQTHRLVEQKRHRKFSAYAQHGLIHYFLAIAIIGFVVPGSVLSLQTHLVIAALTLIHLLIDFAKMELAHKNPVFNGPSAYISDQVLHLLTIIFAAWLLSPGVHFVDLAKWIANIRAMPNKYLAVPVIYMAVLFGGGYLIRFLTRSLAEGVKSHSSERPSTQLQNAGLYIGWLERFLVVTALLLQSPATVGLILASKSVARYPEFETEHFAEYFLIGTLLSISIALIGGVLLVKILFGQLHFTG